MASSSLLPIISGVRPFHMQPNPGKRFSLLSNWNPLLWLVAAKGLPVLTNSNNDCLTATNPLELVWEFFTLYWNQSDRPMYCRYLLMSLQQPIICSGRSAPGIWIIQFFSFFKPLKPVFCYFLGWWLHKSCREKNSLRQESDGKTYPLIPLK